MTTMPPQNTRRGNSRPTGIPTVDARADNAKPAQPPWLIDRDLDAVAARFDRGISRSVLEWEYRILTARRQG